MYCFYYVNDLWALLIERAVWMFSRVYCNFHSCTVHLYIIKVLSPTDAQKTCFKRSIKIYIKNAPTCFGVITIIKERTI